MSKLRRLALYGASVLVLAALQASRVEELLTGAPGRLFLLGISFFVAMVQVGQATALQVTLHRLEPVRLDRKWLTILLGATAAGALVPLCFSNQMLTLAGTGLCGVVAGCAFSIKNSHRLETDRADGYFASLLIRNVALAVCVICGVMAFGDQVQALHLIAVFFSAVQVLLMLHVERGANHLPLNTLRPLAMGLGASSLYRNDQNIVRSFSVTLNNFAAIHDALIYVSATQAAAGSLMNTMGLPLIRSSGNVAKTRMAIVFPILTVVCFIAGAIFYFFDYAQLAILMAGVIIALNQWFSSLLHFKKKSAYVYLVGVGSVGALYLLMVAGANPCIAYLSYAMVTFSCVWAGSWVWAK